MDSLSLVMTRRWSADCERGWLPPPMSVPRRWISWRSTWAAISRSCRRATSRTEVRSPNAGRRWARILKTYRFRSLWTSERSLRPAVLGGVHSSLLPTPRCLSYARATWPFGERSTFRFVQRVWWWSVKRIAPYLSRHFRGTRCPGRRDGCGRSAHRPHRRLRTPRCENPASPGRVQNLFRSRSETLKLSRSVEVASRT